MRIKTLAVTLLCLVPLLASAQSKVSLRFENEASRMIFTTTGWPTGLPANGELKQDKAFDFPLGTLAPADNLVVWDRDSNNAAIRKVSEIKGDWSVHDSDYRYIGVVKVHIEHEGKPVAAAQVQLDDKAHPQSQILDPSAKGELTFFGIQPGDIKLTLNYRSEGKQAKPLVQINEISLKRDLAEPIVTVSIPDDVETVATSEAKPAPAAGGPEIPAAKAAPQSKVGAFLVYLGILVVAAVAIYLLLTYIKNNQKAVAARLKSLGVDMPDPTPPGAMPPLDPAAQPAPAPIQKIILDDAAPTPLASGPASPAVPVADPQPKLVRDTGEVIALADGENLVGRDPGITLSLPGESTVSRRHASLTRSGANVVLKDLGSTNGTFVNGSKVDVERPLSPGDSVQFGQVKFRFEV